MTIHLEIGMEVYYILSNDQQVVLCRGIVDRIVVDAKGKEKYVVSGYEGTLDASKLTASKSTAKELLASFAKQLKDRPRGHSLGEQNGKVV